MLERFYDELNKYEICIDEAGRGPLAGPVVAASVSIDEKFLPYLTELCNSKFISYYTHQIAHFNELIVRRIKN